MKRVALEDLDVARDRAQVAALAREEVVEDPDLVALAHEGLLREVSQPVLKPNAKDQCDDEGETDNHGDLLTNWANVFPLSGVDGPKGCDGFLLHGYAPF